MSEKRLLEQTLEQKKEIERLQIALLNANAIAETFKNHNEVFNELRNLIDKLTKRVMGIEQEAQFQKQLIVKSLQQKYGTGPTA